MCAGEPKTCSGAEFEDALQEWIGNEEGFCHVQDTPEEAWRDVCARHSIPPIVQKPATYFIVSDVLAAELEKQEEIVSKKLMGEYRVWGCLAQIRLTSDLAEVQALKRILRSKEARHKLLGTLK